MNTTQLEQQVPKLIPIFNGMYKKETPDTHSAITQALKSSDLLIQTRLKFLFAQGYRDLLLVAMQEALLPLWAEQKDKPSLLDVVLSTLFPLACKPVDYSVPSSLKVRPISRITPLTLNLLFAEQQRIAPID